MTNNPPFREISWTAADGRQIPVKDLKLGHLVNILNWVFDNSDKYPSFIKDGLVEEAHFRKFVAFSAKKPYPECIDGRWVMYNPKTGLTAIKPPPKSYLKKAEKNKAYVKMRDETYARRNRNGL